MAALASALYTITVWPPGGFLAKAPGPPGEQLIGWYGDSHAAIDACNYHFAETKKMKEKKNASAQKEGSGSTASAPPVSSGGDAAAR